MDTLLVSAFPGCGKTYFHLLYPEITLDSDSSQFSWIPSKERKPEFPQNYIEHIKQNIGKYKIIFVLFIFFFVIQ